MNSDLPTQGPLHNPDAGSEAPPGTGSSAHESGSSEYLRTGVVGKTELVELGIHHRVSRRTAMQWVLAAVAASSLPTQGRSQPVGRTVTPQENAALQDVPSARGYGTDPKLATPYAPGAFWPLTFTAAQKKTARAIADVMFPADHLGPAASEVGVLEMLDEWVSAPYPQQQSDRPIVLDGLHWLEEESSRRFGKSFFELSVEQQHAICDDICLPHEARAPFKKAAHFFVRFRTVCASAYYATPAGWKAIGYVGNVPLEKFEGPPSEVLQKLGLT